MSMQILYLDGVDKITNDAYSHNVTHKCNSQVIIDFT